MELHEYNRLKFARFIVFVRFVKLVMYTHSMTSLALGAVAAGGTIIAIGHSQQRDLKPFLTGWA